MASLSGLLRKIVPECRTGSLSRRGANVEGEPTMIALRRFGNDQSLRGRVWNSCCNCGMEHLYVFEVFPDPKRPDVWWLNKRPYGNPDRPGRKVAKRTKSAK